MLGFTIIGLLCAAFFFAVVLRRKRGEPGRIACLIAAIAWSAYAAYEGIYISSWLNTIRGAPIRIDLVLFAIPLLIVSIVALVRSGSRS